MDKEGRREAEPIAACLHCYHGKIKGASGLPCFCGLERNITATENLLTFVNPDSSAKHVSPDLFREEEEGGRGLNKTLISLFKTRVLAQRAHTPRCCVWVEYIHYTGS